MPEGADPINSEDSLHPLPPGRPDFTRPWFLYDYVDPAAMFRRVCGWGDDVDYISEGENSEDLSDNPEAGKAVFVPGYV